ncbi:MAG: SDR family oxidoreductase [Bacteroidetes bacterium]|nr:SDR family oxidoreductase [Bacteroidota bacterium]
MRNFESFYIGESASLTHEVRKSDVEKFVELSGDDNKLHVNADFAKLTSFNKPVVHGMLGVSFISTLIGTKIPGDGALWYKQSVEFLLPVRIGDVIEVKLEITGINKKNRSLELKTEIRNQHKQIVTTGTSEVKVIEVKEETNETDTSVKPKQLALVIGASGGIGAGVCAALAKKGFNIAVHYFSNKEEALKVKNAAEEQGVVAAVFQCDPSDASKVNELKNSIERSLGTVTHVINCSTTATPNVKFDVIEWEKFSEHFNVNVKASFNLIKAFLPAMSEIRSGNFIFMTSQYTDSPKPELSYYVMAKSALEGLVRSLAIEYGPKTIRFNLVSPGMTNTALLSDVPEKTKLLSAMNTPLRRMGSVADVANAVCFLASEDSAYITGETLRVNGGQVML